MPNNGVHNMFDNAVETGDGAPVFLACMCGFFHENEERVFTAILTEPPRVGETVCYGEGVGDREFYEVTHTIRVFTEKRTFKSDGFPDKEFVTASAARVEIKRVG